MTADGWTRVSLGEVASEVRERCDDPVAADIERCVRGEDFDSGETRVTRWGRVPDDMGPTFTKRFRPGHILYGTRRAYLRKGGVVGFDGVCANTTLVLEVNGSVVLPELIPHIIQSETFVEFAVGSSVGSTNPFTKWSDLRTYEFDLPPLDRQREVLALLQSVEKALSMAKLAARSATQIRESVIERSFKWGEPSTLGTLVSGGGVVLITGPFGTVLRAADYVDDAIPVINVSHIVNGVLKPSRHETISADTYDRLSKHHLREGDIVMGRKGDIGRSALVHVGDLPALAGSDTIVIRSTSEDVPPEELVWLLRSKKARSELMRRSPGTTMPGINERSLSFMPLPVLDESLRDRLVTEHETISSAQSITDAHLDRLARLRLQIRNQVLVNHELQ